MGTVIVMTNVKMALFVEETAVSLILQGIPIGFSLLARLIAASQYADHYSTEYQPRKTSVKMDSETQRNQDFNFFFKNTPPPPPHEIRKQKKKKKKKPPPPPPPQKKKKKKKKK